jgi:DNA-binding CsgD family transcriptional regulator
MDALGIARLTEAQRVALRLFMERKTAKQIALELGITPKAVELRLKGARDALGVSTSAEAARLLTAVENNITFRQTLGGSTEVADPVLSRLPPSIEGESGGAGEARDRKVLSEARIAFAHQPARLQMGLGWPLPPEGDGRNELGLSARLLWPFLAIFGMGVAVGTLVIGGSLLSLAGVAVMRLFR